MPSRLVLFNLFLRELNLRKTIINAETRIMRHMGGMVMMAINGKVLGVCVLSMRFTVAGFGQGDDAGLSRRHMLGQALDRAVLAGGVAPLQHDDHARAMLDAPGLGLDDGQLNLLQLGVIGVGFLSHSKRVGRGPAESKGEGADCEAGR